MPIRSRKRGTPDESRDSARRRDYGKDQAVNPKGKTSKQTRSKAKSKHAKGSASSITQKVSFATLFFIIVLFLIWSFKQEESNNSNDQIKPSNNDKEVASNQNIQNTKDFLSRFVCNHPNGYCNPHLNPVSERRTHNAKKSIPAKDAILVLPRELCITDLDALRDETFVRKELSGTRHLITKDPLDSGAYLAAYLVRRHQLINNQFLSTESSKPSEEEEKYVLNDPKESDSMYPFFDILPSVNTLQKTTNHPILWSVKKAERLLGKHTLSFMTLKAFQDMVLSEYQSFASQSLTFKKEITRPDYIAMRINVMSRSFGTGPPGPEEADPSFIFPRDTKFNSVESNTNTSILNKELEYYQNTSGIHLEKGCRAMSPILDMWDHHANPNVEWRYNNNRRAFIVTAKEGGIPKGNDVMVSYGKYTDAHLFSKFGFVNGDGSGWTEGSIANFHTITDAGLGHQYAYRKLDLKTLMPSFANYFAFDDGYSSCIKPPSSQMPSSSPNEDIITHWNFKRMKIQHLYRLSNRRKYWVFKLPPRNPNSRPSISSDKPIDTDSVPRFNSKSTQTDFGSRFSKLLMTCRLISLNEDDYDGNAYSVLSDALENSLEDPILVPRQSDFLEHRALTCIMRLSLVALSRYPNSIGENLSIIRGESDDAYSFQSSEWYAAHVKLGEMQSLEVLQRYASSGAEEMKKKILEEFDERKEGNENHKRNLLEQKLRLRQKPCPSNPILWENL